MKHRTVCLAAITAAALATPAGHGQDPGGTHMQDNVVVLLDASGSMLEKMKRGAQPKMQVAKQALQQVLADVPDTTNLGILVFGGRNVPDRWIYPLGPIDRNRSQGLGGGRLQASRWQRASGLLRAGVSDTPRQGFRPS